MGEGVGECIDGMIDDEIALCGIRLVFVGSGPEIDTELSPLRQHTVEG